MSIAENLICYMPLTSNLDFLKGTAPATFTRSSIATFIDISSGLVKTAAANETRFELAGGVSKCKHEGASTNEALHSRDFTDSVWVATNITPLKDAIGNDGVANAASTLTATAANGTIFQTITKASTENTYSIDVRRKTGSGTIEISDDGGSTFTDITSSINSTTYTRFEITTTQANPSIGFRIVTSGDEVESDYSQLEALGFSSSRIETSGSTVTRAEETLIILAANWPTLNTEFTLAIDLDNMTDGSVAATALRINGTSGTNDLSCNTGDRYQFGYAGVFSIDSGTVTTGGVSRVAVTWATGGSQKIYTEAVLKDTDAAVNVGGSVTSLAIGKRSAANANFYGHLSELRIYDKELTADEVLEDLIFDFHPPSLAGPHTMIQSMVGSMIRSIVN